MLCSPHENDMRRVGCGNMLCNTIAELHCVETRKKMLAGTEKGWSNREVHLVDQSCAKVLLDRGDSAVKSHISSIGSFRGAFQRGMHVVRDEVKCRVVVHRDRCTWVIGQHEDRYVIRRVVTPPTFPDVV